MPMKVFNVRLDPIEREAFEKLTKELGYESLAQHMRLLIRRELKAHKKAG